MLDRRLLMIYGSGVARSLRLFSLFLIGLGFIIGLYPMISVARLSDQVLGELPDVAGIENVDLIVSLVVGVEMRTKLDGHSDRSDRLFQHASVAAGYLPTDSSNPADNRWVTR